MSGRAIGSLCGSCSPVRLAVLRPARSPRGWALGLCAMLALVGCTSKGGAGSPSAASGAGGLVSGGTGAGAGASSTGGIGTSGSSGGMQAGAAGGGGAQGLGGALGSDEEYPVPSELAAETGAELWLRYRQVPIPGRLAEYRAAFTHVVNAAATATLELAAAELERGLSGLTGTGVTIAAAPQAAGAVLIGTPVSSPAIAGLPLASRLPALGPDGYLVEVALVDGQTMTVVAANSDVGVLYGSFALLRHLQSHSAIANLALGGSPKIQRRILNHWDNLDRSVERGYAGQSLWNWEALPATLSPRYTEYARANASLGINGTVLTNVNADAQVLTASYLTKVKAIADLLRPYGMRVYLTARFNAPMSLGGLTTADPVNTGVQQWWVSKATEIYAIIPDFGGLLVKANSEGQPGPQDYGRSHALGANMLADALAPHGGIVMWRAFVYSEDSPADRVRQAYDEFQPLDGEFRDNVLLQVKNGPLDFQPREPFHPLLGAMPGTPLALELQVTKEYLGQDTHLAYLGPLWQEVLRAEAGAQGASSRVARVVDGSLHGYTTTAIAGVANVGEDANWTGSHFNQANWYAFGRMAWDPDISAQMVAEEWVRQTLSNDPVVTLPVTDMLMKSHQTLVDYMTPLGLAHIMGSDHHYGPAPWVSNLSRAEWNPVYYHQASAQGIGFDRSASGSNAVEQYSDSLTALWGSRETVPDDLLLFFHRVGWQETLSSGRTLWDELVHRYSRGVDEVGKMRSAWDGVAGRLDSQRFAEVQEFLEIQHYEARWWRDACLSYFGQVAGLALPSGYAPPSSSLSTYQGLNCPSDVKKPRCSAVYTGAPSPAILP